MVGSLNISLMFLGVNGVSPQHGFTTHSELEARVAQLLIERSSRVYAVFDHSKFMKSALFTIGPLARADGVVTDKKPDPHLLRACEEAGLDVRWAEEDDIFERRPMRQ